MTMQGQNHMKNEFYLLIHNRCEHDSGKF